ncbi:MAG: SusC/RagA family TonB-linked outer membrane protein [Odoribacteraceae bacterium]|jgi:TonB-linked SusC/RagA family outer membrane protein|nr:SusC/RagA family TonB-linked outer membrane protein [Odoribacteraceae bacterium]
MIRVWFDGSWCPRGLLAGARLTLLLACCLARGVSAEVFSQPKVRMELRGVTIKEALAEYQRQTGTMVLYSGDRLESGRRVDAVFEAADAATFFAAVLEGSGMWFREEEGYVLIVPATGAPQERAPVARGRVTDEGGEPLPGVSILLKGTTRGGTTGVDGRFSIPLPGGEGHALVFSFVGMKGLEMAARGEGEMTVVMVAAEREIGGVVVTGMFTRRASSYTGAVSVVTGEELRRVGNSNLVSVLKNVDPSFTVVENLQAGSNPNAEPEIQMRGQTGLSHVGNDYRSNPNQPLFILDGFEATLTKILDLDMNLVESVTLLKDATAKAIYGSRAANGVVVVETTRPSKGRMKVSYSGSLEVQAPDLSSYNLTNAREKLEAERRAGLYSSASAVTQINLSHKYADLTRLVEAGVDTYWLDKPLRVGTGQKHSLYLEGGDDFMLYAVDVSYQGVAGVMKGSDRSTVSGGVTLSYRANNFLFRDQLSLDGNRSSDSPYGSFSTFTLMNPYNMIRDENGNMVQQYAYGAVVQPNPLWNGEVNTRYDGRYTYITNNFYAEWRAREFLRFTARFGFSARASTADSFKPGEHTDFFSYAGEGRYSQGQYFSTRRQENNASGDAGVAWSVSGGGHMLFANAQVSISQNSYDYYTVGVEGFPNRNMNHLTFGVAYAGTKPDGVEGISRETGGVASVNYSYDDRYLFDGNYRLSGSSEFGANQRWGHFYSLGVGWNANEEKFLREVGWLDRLKFRLSTGYTGSQGFNSYDAIATVVYYPDQQYGGRIGSYLHGLANPDLRWQRRYDTNAGVDVTALNGRLNARFNYYSATTKGVVADITTPQSMGFPAYMANVGEMENKGFDVYASWRAWERRDSGSFLTFFLSAASNSNRLTKISNALKRHNDDGDSAQDSDDTMTSVTTRYEEGASTTAIWVVRSLGIDPMTGREVFVKKDGSLTETWRSSDYVNGGDALPKVSGNFGVNAEYHGLGLNATFTWRSGGQLYNNTLVSKVENADARYNVDRRVLRDRWGEAGQAARFKSIADNSPTRPTSRFVEDYDALTFASLHLFYDFREHDFVRRSFLQRLKASFYMNDLFVISTVRTERGTDYPFARSFSLSLQANF